MGESVGIVDAHVHLWHQDSTRYPSKPWIQGPLPPIDGTAERLVELMDKAGVAWALNVQVPWYGEDNSYHRDACAAFPGRFKLLSVLENPEAPDAPDRLERQVTAEGSLGFRIHFCEPGRREQALAGQFDHLLKKSAELGTVVQLLAWLEDVPAIQHMVRHHPGTIFVIDHLCHADVAEGPPYPSSRGFLDLGKADNVYVKVSLLCDLSHEDYPYPDVQQFVQTLLEHYPPNRLMWGSNYPLIPEVRKEQPVDYVRSLELVRSDWPWLDDSTKEWILGRTAQTLFSR